MPCSAASRRANGEAITRSPGARRGAGAGADGSGASTGGGGSGGAPGGMAPASSRDGRIGWFATRSRISAGTSDSSPASRQPTIAPGASTVPSGTSCFSTPGSSASTSVSTFSVSISKIAWPGSTDAPSSTSQRTSSPESIVMPSFGR